MCYFVLLFFSPFSIAITSLGEERANLSDFHMFVRFVLFWFCLFPLPLGFWEGLLFVIVALPGLFSYLFLHVCPGKIFILESCLASFFERNSPFSFLLVVFWLWCCCFKYVLSLWCLWRKVVGNCIHSWSLPSFLFDISCKLSPMRQFAWNTKNISEDTQEIPQLWSTAFLFSGKKKIRHMFQNVVC